MSTCKVEWEYESLDSELINILTAYKQHGHLSGTVSMRLELKFCTRFIYRLHKDSIAQIVNPGSYLDSAKFEQEEFRLCAQVHV